MKLQPSVLFPFLAVLILLGIFASLMQFSPESNNPFDAGTILEFRRIKNRMLSTSVGAPFYRVSGFDSLRYFQPDQAHVYLADFQPVRDGDLLDLMPDMPGIPSHSVAGFAVVKKMILKTPFLFSNLPVSSRIRYFLFPFQMKATAKKLMGADATWI